MSELNPVAMRWAIGAIVWGAIFCGTMVHAEQAPDPRTYVPPVIKPRAAPPQRPVHSRPTTPSAVLPNSARESESASALGSPVAFSTVGHETAAAGTPLTAPVSIVYGGGSLALSVTDSGTNKAIASYITNSKNTTSALYGQTNGAGAGVTGYNIGLTGPAGKFEVTNTASEQPAITATTVGLGPAILGTASMQKYGVGIQGNSTATYGVGVQGYGSDSADGVYGASYDGVGVSAQSYMGIALYAETDDGPDAIFATNTYSTAISAQTEYGVGVSVDGGDMGGAGIVVTTGSGTGIHVYSSVAPALYAESGGSSYAIWGQSSNAVGVMGKDSGSGYGIYGSSVAGYAGYFDGKVAATSFVTLSDRDAKTNLQPVDRKEILERVGRLTISSWDFKSDLDSRHVGPMAQDFHAAFGLGGQDDTHINLADVAGISLAAIQELNAKLQVKDLQIADLTAQLAAQSQAVAELKSFAEHLAVRVSSMEHQ